MPIISIKDLSNLIFILSIDRCCKLNQSLPIATNVYYHHFLACRTHPQVAGFATVTIFTHTRFIDLGLMITKWVLIFFCEVATTKY
ncbi:hypothetical protein BLOT_000261 [Blomia tropicalis]|nr:hypothetical protein BLOT_000261 [Blomia tropicalis]